MSRTDRDVTRVVRSWLEEGVTALPDRVLDAVLDQLPATPQRRSLWSAWRRPDMNNSLRIGLAAAAVVVIALIGYQLLSGPNVGGPAPVETPSVAPSEAPTAAPTPTPASAFPPAGPLAIGRHSMTLSGVPFTFELLTDGWISNGDFGIDKGHQDTRDSAGFIFWRDSAPDNVFADPCAETPLSPAPGPSAAELAAAVSTVPGLDLISGPADVTVDGRPAKHVVVTVPDEIGCNPNDFYLWQADGLGRYATELNSTIYVWIIDVDGTLVWIDGETYVESGPEAEQEIRQIVDSIVFE